MNIFSDKLIGWYEKHKRKLPWRGAGDPYLIWLSEIILQQTRVRQGLGYYNRFAERFPVIKDLAEASEDEVLKLWQGLGYYSRARNLHFTAMQIYNELGGKFPDSYNELLKLKGVGPYTAAAIASIAFNLPYPVVDGNVYRVLARVFGIETTIESEKGKTEFLELSGKLIDRKQPGLYNQAMMEFGAMQCMPKKPRCGNCFLNSCCIAFAKKITGRLPVKLKTSRQRNRYFNYLVIRHNGSVYLNKRTRDDIWKNLYEFPLIETKRAFSENRLVKQNEWKNIFNGTDYAIRRIHRPRKHTLSHQTIHAKFWEVDLSCMGNGNFNAFIQTNYEEISKFAVPKLIENYLFNASI